MFNLKNFLISPLGIAIIGCGCILAIGITFSQLSDDILPSDVIDSSFSSSRDQPTEIGGVLRPRSDVDGMVNWNEKVKSNADELKPTKLMSGAELKEKGIPVKSSFGVTPLLAPSESPVIQATFDAIKSKEPKADRTYNLFAEIEPFDEARYLSNPQAYLNSVEPGRIWQSAQPGAGVPQVKRIGPSKPSIVQGETVKLQLKTTPFGVANYMSYDLGAFQNRLGAITVAADENGIATAEFTGTPGTINEVRVVASSPMASGITEFMVRVLPRATQQ